MYNSSNSVRHNKYKYRALSPIHVKIYKHIGVLWAWEHVEKNNSSMWDLILGHLSCLKLSKRTCFVLFSGTYKCITHIGHTKKLKSIQFRYIFKFRRILKQLFQNLQTWIKECYNLICLQILEKNKEYNWKLLFSNWKNKMEEKRKKMLK